MPSQPTPNKIAICSNALLRLGAKPIGSFTEGTDRATLCANIYPLKKDDILSIYDWKFTIVKQELNLKAAAPVSAWGNEFQLPGNRLTDGIVALYDSATDGVQPFKDFELQGDGILTEASSLFLDYQSNGSDEATWPPYFVELVVKAMMVELVIPVTDQSGTYQTLYQQVYGGPGAGGMGGMVGRAMARNSSEDPPDVFTDFSLTMARAEGS